MAAHAYLKNEFTEDKKCQNLMSWLKCTYCPTVENRRTGHDQPDNPSARNTPDFRMYFCTFYTSSWRWCDIVVYVGATERQIQYQITEGQTLSRFIGQAVIYEFESAHEIMVLFVFRKLILQTRMRTHPIRLDFWSGPFVYWAVAGRLCDKYHNLMSWL